MKSGFLNRSFSLFKDKRFLIFIIIGIINTLNNTIISYLLSLKLNANISFVAGYMISLLIAYLLNSVFNFKQKMTALGFVKFFISYIPNFIIQNAIVIVFYNILTLPKIIAYGAAAVIGIPVTFAILKLFAFKNDNKNEAKRR